MEANNSAFAILHRQHKNMQKALKYTHATNQMPYLALNTNHTEPYDHC